MIVISRNNVLTIIPIQNDSTTTSNSNHINTEKTRQTPQTSKTEGVRQSLARETRGGRSQETGS